MAKKRSYNQFIASIVFWNKKRKDKCEAQTVLKPLNRTLSAAHAKLVHDTGFTDDQHIAHDKVNLYLLFFLL